MKALYLNHNNEVMKYNEKELIELLADKKTYFPEISETDEESQSHIINVYDLS